MHVLEAIAEMCNSQDGKGIVCTYVAVKVIDLGIMTCEPLRVQQ